MSTDDYLANTSLVNEYILDGRYKIIGNLGGGGFGITYLAEELTLHKKVAIKEFMPREQANRSQINMSISPYRDKAEEYEHLIKKFEEEAKLLVGLKHPNIVKVWELIKANNTVYMVMEYEEGEDLKSYLEKHKNLKEDEIIRIINPVLEAVKYLHIKGILHRDIAPDNIYIREDGTPLVIDFGSARDIMAKYSKNISSIIKDGYSPPEQYSHATQSPPTDIYALGAVLYEMMSGQRPVSSQARQHNLYSGLADPLENLSLICKKKYSQKLINIVNKAMEIKMQDRFQGISDIQHSLFSESIINIVPKKNLFKVLAVSALFIIFGLFIFLLTKNGFSDTSSDKNISSNIETNDTLGVVPFLYSPPKISVDSTLKASVEVGAEGFNCFVIKIDKDKNWKIEDSKYGYSLIYEGKADADSINDEFKKYISKTVNLGVKPENIHFIVSSGALLKEETRNIINVIKKNHFIPNEVTAENEGKYGFWATIPKEYQNNSFFVDIGSGNTKIAWLENGKFKTISTYGAKYYLDNKTDADVYKDIKNIIANQIPKANQERCFIIGGVPFELAKISKKKKEDYTTLYNPNEYLDHIEKYEIKEKKVLSGLNIYKAIDDSTETEQFIFAWNSNFTIGYLLKLPY